MMSSEEMQRIIEQMLTVQRELQEGQLRIQESQLRFEEHQLRQQRILDRLIGYSITTESKYLDLEERLNQLEQKIRRMEES